MPQSICADRQLQQQKDVRTLMGDISNTQYFKEVQDEKKMQVSQVLHDVY